MAHGLRVDQESFAIRSHGPIIFVDYPEDGEHRGFEEYLRHASVEFGAASDFDRRHLAAGEVEDFFSLWFQRGCMPPPFDTINCAPPSFGGGKGLT